MALLILFVVFMVLEANRWVDSTAASAVGLGGAAVGLGAAGLLIARGGVVIPRAPLLLLLLAGMAGLYTLFNGVLQRLETVTLPAYLPNAGVEVVCAAGLGLIGGAVAPLVLYALVAGLFQWLMRE